MKDFNPKRDMVRAWQDTYIVLAHGHFIEVQTVDQRTGALRKHYPRISVLLNMRTAELHWSTQSTYGVPDPSKESKVWSVKKGNIQRKGYTDLYALTQDAESLYTKRAGQTMHPVAWADPKNPYSPSEDQVHQGLVNYFAWQDMQRQKYEAFLP